MDEWDIDPEFFVPLLFAVSLDARQNRLSLVSPSSL